MKKSISIFAFFLCLASFVNAQVQNRSISDYLDSYVGENAVPYVQPLADMFTSSINTGVWEWSSIPDKLYVRVKLQGMASWPDASMRSFKGVTTGDFSPQQTASVPTIIGDNRSVTIQGENNEIYVFPGGYDLKRLVIGTPQVTVGGFLNSEVSARFLSFSMDDEIGHVQFYGIGARHAINNYFENSPIDFSVGYFYQRVDAGDYLESNQHLVSALVGKSGKLLSGHLSLGYQMSKSDIHYVYEEGVEEFEINLDIENKNPWIIEAGMGLRLGPVFASSSISYSKHPTLSLGAGLFF
ncbi:MAG: hypothetical protein M3R25_15390 [Bacteroidota bacterium]|nr:hypothetical protein [Bacteroidota bacterium]